MCMLRLISHAVDVACFTWTHILLQLWVWWLWSTTFKTLWHRVYLFYKYNKFNDRMIYFSASCWDSDCHTSPLSSLSWALFPRFVDVTRKVHDFRIYFTNLDLPLLVDCRRNSMYSVWKGSVWNVISSYLEFNQLWFVIISIYLGLYTSYEKLCWRYTMQSMLKLYFKVIEMIISFRYKHQIHIIYISLEILMSYIYNYTQSDGKLHSN